LANRQFFFTVKDLRALEGANWAAALDDDSYKMVDGALFDRRDSQFPCNEGKSVSGSVCYEL
jgi:hypothetical protein